MKLDQIMTKLWNTNVFNFNIESFDENLKFVNEFYEALLFINELHNFIYFITSDCFYVYKHY